MIKRVKIHRSIDKRGKSSLIYFPSGLKTSIKIEFHGGKEWIGAANLVVVSGHFVGFKFKLQSQNVFLCCIPFFICELSVWLIHWYFKSPTYTAFMHSLPGCLIFSLLQKNYSPGGQSIAIFFHVCVANGNIQWSKWQNAAIVVVAAVYLIILILSYKMDNHWKRYIGLSVILSLPFTFTASLGFVLCKLERYEENIRKREKAFQLMLNWQE